MTRTSFLIASVASLMLAAGSAQAQKAGTYAGTSADGGNISLTVTGTDPNFTISSMNVNFMANCTHPVSIANEGWGFFLGQAIVGGDNAFHSGNDYYDIRGLLHFVGHNTIKGTITSVTAVFVEPNDPPIKAHFCKSPKQAFQLTFQAAPTPPPAGNAVVLPKQKW